MNLNNLKDVFLTIIGRPRELSAVEQFRKACRQSSEQGAEVFIRYAKNLHADSNMTKIERFLKAEKELAPQTYSQLAALRRARREYGLL